MKTIYLVWKDRHCNGVNPEWQELTGKGFYSFIKKPENKERHFIKLYGDNESDSIIMIESTEKEYIAWRKDKDHCDWIRKGQMSTGYQVVSYHAMETEDGCFGEELLPDETVSVEDDCFLLMDKKILKSALKQLTEEEYRLMAYFYLNDEKGTERGYAAITGLPQKTVHNRKVAVLKKIKRFINK